MDTIQLTVEQDHVESLAKVRNPIIAIEELIWNGLDADATQVDVSLDFNDLGGLVKIRVSDNGRGISRETGIQAFGHLGGSAKSNMHLTPGGRIPQGKSGKGRFRAFGIGGTVTWISRYQSNCEVRRFEIKGRKSYLKQFSISREDAIQGSNTGVDVTISGIETNFSSLINSSKAAEELSKRLAMYLYKYPGINITYDGIKVDPGSLQEHSDSYSLQLLDADGGESEAELTVIEWKTPTERALYFCNADGFALEECPPGIQAPGFHFTAYLKSMLIPNLANDGAFALNEMHPTVSSIIDSAKQVLRNHFRHRESSRAINLLMKWQEEKIYPYAQSEQDPLKKAEREVFDVCAVKVHEYLPSFEKSDVKNKQLTFRLIREALESNPDSLHTILQQVLNLPQDQQDDLAAILDRTHLAAIINAAKTVVDRLDFVGSLDPLLFGELKPTLLERKHLHRILAEELWLFGEQYTLGTDDESLASTLKKHVRILGRTDLITDDFDDVKDLDGKQRILDLMLYRQIPQLQPNRFEHLVVELKRPDYKLGQKEIGQIENYAFSVAEDPRFDKEQTKWTFILIGNELAPFAEQKCRQLGKEFGHIHTSDDGAVNIYVKKWSAVIAEATWRYQFFKRKLELEVTTADGLRYLRDKHAGRLPLDQNAKSAISSDGVW